MASQSDEKNGLTKLVEVVRAKNHGFHGRHPRLPWWKIGGAFLVIGMINLTIIT
jgi:hypothetical protein